MKDKIKNQVTNDLVAAGLSLEDATVYAGAAGLHGVKVSTYKIKHKRRLVEISPKQQYRLFNITYSKMEADVKRICQKDDVVSSYGATDWDNLNPTIKELIIDLRYRGDYTGETGTNTRSSVQKYIASNDLEGLTAVLGDRKLWVSKQNVPIERFKQRHAYAKKALDLLLKPNNIQLITTSNSSPIHANRYSDTDQASTVVSHHENDKKIGQLSSGPPK